jgi:hypothetical protein
VPALSEGWKGSFRTLLAQAEGDPATAPAWSGFRPLRVAEIRPESATVKREGVASRFLHQHVAVGDRPAGRRGHRP